MNAVKLAFAVAAVAVSLVLGASGVAVAAAPDPPVITEPTVGATPNAADVHMEAGAYNDPDGDAHFCSDWEIHAEPANELVWQAPCKQGVERVHVHLGDGTLMGSYAGRTDLLPDTDYRLRVRFRDSSVGNPAGPYATRNFTTAPAGPAGTDVPWTVQQPGYQVDVVATGLQLPTDIAFVPNPGDGPNAPLFYVTELYGSIAAVTRDGSVHEYAHSLLNFNPTGDFPGSGEQGVAGVTVDPESGDVFASMPYEDGPSGDHWPKVVRFHSDDGGLTASSEQTILDMPGETMAESHQISNLTIGPDGKLYVHLGDGFFPDTAQDLTSFRGKILRVNLDGSAPPDNPFYDGAPITARDYVYAYGFRNPFGGTWRASDNAHYEVENGPSVDRLARIDPGINYGFDGSDESMRTRALYNWEPAHAPTNIAFTQPQTFCGSGFPAAKMDHAFVAESGPTYASGPQELGKRIVEFTPNAGGGFDGPTDLVDYTGTGKATVIGLAAGPDGLYFTDLYKDQDFTSPIDGGANVLRVSYTGSSDVDCSPPAGGGGGADAPETTITHGPKRKQRSKRARRRVRFRFVSAAQGASFECRLDGGAYKPCASPRETTVKAGRHRFKAHEFQVRSSNAAGTDQTPAAYRWKLKRKR